MAKQSPFTEEQRRDIYNSSLKGESVQSIADRLCEGNKFCIYQARRTKWYRNFEKYFPKGVKLPRSTQASVEQTVSQVPA